MASVPTIPNIEAPQVQNSASGVDDTINSLLKPLAEGMNKPLPDPYTVGKDVATPHITGAAPYQPVEGHNTPITGQVADVKRARRQNAVAGLANTIGSFANKLNARKQQGLQDKLVDVMKSKQNVENAEKVLQTPGISDAQRKMAQSVIDANKKNLDTILSDPKNQKELKKALDISYVDPEKNKTPEVQALQGAMKEFQQAGPFNADNPQEHAVAQLANGGGGSMHPAQSQQTQSTNPQQPNIVPANTPILNNVAPGQTPPKPQAAQSQSAGPQSQQTRSATPYADAALAKDMPTLEVNPQYTQALAQQQLMQKTYLQMLPKIIDAGIKAQIQSAKDGNAAQLAVFRENAKYRDQIMQDIAKSALEQQTARNAMARVGAENANRVLLARMRIDAQLKVSDSPYLTPEQRAAIKTNAKDETEKNVNQSAANVAKFDADMQKLLVIPEDKRSSDEKEMIKSLQVQRSMEMQALTKFQEMRAEKFNIPLQKAPVVTQQPKPVETENWMEKLMNEAYGKNKEPENKQNAGPNSTTESEPTVEHVGADESDEPEDNSDDYGQSTSQ